MPRAARARALWLRSTALTLANFARLTFSLHTPTRAQVLPLLHLPQGWRKARHLLDAPAQTSTKLGYRLLGAVRAGTLEQGGSTWREEQLQLLKVLQNRPKLYAHGELQTLPIIPPPPIHLISKRGRGGMGAPAKEKWWLICFAKGGGSHSSGDNLASNDKVVGGGGAGC